MLRKEADFRNINNTGSSLHMIYEKTDHTMRLSEEPQRQDVFDYSFLYTFLEKTTEKLTFSISALSQRQRHSQDDHQ